MSRIDYAVQDCPNSKLGSVANPIHPNPGFVRNSRPCQKKIGTISHHKRTQDLAFSRNRTWSDPGDAAIRRTVLARAALLGRPIASWPEARQAAHPRATLEKGEIAKKRAAEADPPDGTGISPRSGGGASPKIRSLKDAEEFGWDLGAAQVGELGEVGGDASEPKVERREVSEGKSQLGPSEREGCFFFKQ